MLPRLAVRPRAVAARRGERSDPDRCPGRGCPSCPGRPSASCWRRRAIRARRSVGVPDRRPRRRGRPIGALVFHAATIARRRPEGGFGTNGGRVLTVVGRGPDLAAARTRAGDGGRRDLVARDAASPRHRGRAAVDAGGRRRTGRGAGVIRRYTLPEMGAIWSDQARWEQMLRVELAVARAQVARGLVPPAAYEAIAGARGSRRRAHRRDRAGDRPRRHRLRQPGRRDDRRRGAVSPPWPDQQRRRRHRTGPPADGRRRAAPRGHRPGASRSSSGGPATKPRRS